MAERLEEQPHNAIVLEVLNHSDEVQIVVLFINWVVESEEDEAHKILDFIRLNESLTRALEYLNDEALLRSKLGVKGNELWLFTEVHEANRVLVEVQVLELGGFGEIQNDEPSVVEDQHVLGVEILEELQATVFFALEDEIVQLEDLAAFQGNLDLQSVLKQQKKVFSLDDEIHQDATVVDALVGIGVV